MKISNYWKQFEQTGRVEDYLSYVSGDALVSSETSGSQDTFVPLRQIAQSEIPAGTKILGSVQVETQGNSREEAGANSYAGIHMCNRNDIETGAYRGI